MPFDRRTFRRFAAHPRRLMLAGLAAWALARAPAAELKTAGQSYFGTHQYVEYVAGNLPLVLVSPHGGRLRPNTVPDRKEGVVDADWNSQEVARAIHDECLARTGRHVHLVASQLHRRKLDPNRELREAAQGNAAAERAWREFHAAIEGACASAVAEHGFAFLIDVHGHAHPIARLELGYGLRAAQLNQPDADFDRAGAVAASTVRDLHARVGGSGAALIRGPQSLGALLAERGYRAVPSPQDPGPGGNPFFSGGYIVLRHAGNAATTKVDGVQLEMPRIGIRDTPANRAAFARAVVDVLNRFFRDRYQFDFLARATP